MKNIEDIAFKNFYKIIKPYLLSTDYTAVTKFSDGKVSGYNDQESGFYFFGYIDNFLDNYEINLLKQNIKIQLFNLFGIKDNQLDYIFGDPEVYLWGKKNDIILEMSIASDEEGYKFISVTFAINKEIINLFNQIGKNVGNK